MIVHDLSPDALGRIARADLATLGGRPPEPIEPFGFNGCVCGVASFTGCPPWELHGDGDELLHVLAGSTTLTLRETGGETARILRAGDLAIVPQGCWHRNDAPSGVTILYLSPRDGGRNSWDDPATLSEGKE
jgi:mannose-6-phosphate isomerase-like protein (cupin superfamily)